MSMLMRHVLILVAVVGATLAMLSCDRDGMTLERAGRAGDKAIKDTGDKINPK